MERLALVDNATLTSVQRLLGTSQVKNLYNTDGAIAAFEGMLHAILFFDNVACIDDYKPEYRDSRVRQFSFIRFISPNEIEYERLMCSAREATKDVLLEIEGRNIVDLDFSKFFEMLRCQLVFNWRLQTSVFYLTLNLLGDSSGLPLQKYGAVQAMLKTQFWGEGGKNSASSDLNVRDSHGKQLPERFTRDKEFAISDEIKSFAAALNWLALKSSFYCFVADATGANIVLHPIRHAFLSNQLNRIWRLPGSTYDILTRVVRDGIRDTVNEIRSVTDPILTQLRLPIFSAYLATRTKDPKHFLNEALQMKEEGLFSEARQQLQELEEIKATEFGGYVTAVNKLQRALAGTSQRLLQKYGVQTPQGLPIGGIANLALKGKTAWTIPNGAKVPTPHALIGLTDRFGFRGLFRSIAEELMSIERLGQLHDVITSAVHRDKNASESRVYEEDPRWLGRDNSIKRYL
jgi:hypothetical protein